MSLPLGNHADIESSVEKLRRRELAQSEDRAVEIEIAAARGIGLHSALSG